MYHIKIAAFQATTSKVNIACMLSKYPNWIGKIVIQGGQFHLIFSTMAAQQQDQQGVSPFPTPPSVFYKLYTDERVKSGQAPKPPAPVKGTYTMFGAPFNVYTEPS